VPGRALRHLCAARLALARYGARRARRRLQRRQADVVGIGKRGLLPAHRAHPDALVDVEAAGLDDAFLQTPRLAARVLEIEVSVVHLVREDLAEHGLQLPGIKGIRSEQDLVRGRERGFALETAGFLTVFGLHGHSV